MDIIRKMSMAAAAFVMCMMLCACSTVKKVDVDSSISTDNNSVLEPVIISTEDIEIPQQTTSADEFTAAGSQGITDGDEDTMVALCDLMCHKWAKSYNKKEKDYYTGLVNNSNFINYLNLTALNIAIESISDSSDAAFTFESMTVDGNFATLTGLYSRPNSGEGIFTFIVENVNGRFCVNDMVYQGGPGSADPLVRPEFIQSPTPNYWQSDENFAAAEKILTGI